MNQFIESNESELIYTICLESHNLDFNKTVLKYSKLIK